VAGLAVDQAEELEFGRFRLRRRERVLLADGVRVDLGSRAIDVLLALLDADGGRLSKDDLLRQVWPDVLVEENNLQVQISALRKALGADRELIQTVPRYGYRFAGQFAAHAIPRSGTEAPAAKLPPGDLPPGNQPPGNLPAAVSGLIGRDIELREIVVLQTSRRLLSLTGPGGIGKTRLALDAARSLAGQFADGVFLVELAPLTDPSLVPATVASVLGMDLAGTPPSPERIAAVLAARRLLLVLDNCEHVIEAAARITEALLRSAPGIKILATSREPLRAEGESVYRVPPLAVPSEAVTQAEHLLRHGAVELFIARAASADTQFALDDAGAALIGGICRRLDGMPLAIELAAARASSLGLVGLAQRLDDRFELLTQGRRTALPRHQTLRATLDWSHDLLDATEQIVLRRLSVFSGAFSLRAAAAVVSDDAIEPASVIDCVASLVAKSLAVSEIGKTITRYRLLETTKAYAQEKLRSNGEFATVASRHAAYSRLFFTEAETNWPITPEAEWVARYAAMIGNLRAALHWSFSPSGDPATGVALAAHASVVFLQLSLLGECRQYAELALARLDDVGAMGTRQEMLLRAALGMSLLYTRGPVPGTDAIWERVLQLAEALGDVEHQLRALYGLWLYRLLVCDYRIALSLAHNFRRIGEGRGLEADQAMAERMIGFTLHYLGDQTGAHSHAASSLLHPPPANRRLLTVRYGIDLRVGALVVAARALWLQGLPDRAASLAQEAVNEATRLDHANSLCLALADGGGSVAAWNGDLVAMQRFAEMLGHRADTHGLGVWQVYARAMHGAVQARRGDTTTGMALLRAALTDLTDTPTDIRYSIYLCWLAEALGAAGDISAALSALAEVEERSRRHEELAGLAELLRLKGELLLRLDEADPEISEQLFLQAKDLAHQQGAMSWELRAVTSLARLRPGHLDLLATTYRRFTEGFDTADLAAARALLDAAS
jgi:predicted ATPase/DNA-binding winged helix-turn-helix (wHTH) protein